MAKPSKVVEISVEELRGKVDFGIITMREDEMEAVMKRFPRTLRATAKAVYNVAPLNCDCGDGPPYVAVMRTVAQGPAEAQKSATNLIHDLNPRCIVLVGIAGAKPETEFSLGDVIVATRVYDFGVTAKAPGKDPTYQDLGGPMHERVRIAIANLVAEKELLGSWNSEQAIGLPLPKVDIENDELYKGKNEDWKKKVRESLLERFRGQPPRQPCVTAAPIVGSSVLMKDPEAFGAWLEHARDVKGVEMELGGVYTAARGVDGDRPVLAIRGFSDIVGYEREGAWTKYACESAASFAKALLTAGLLKLPTYAELSASNPSASPSWNLTAPWHLKNDLARLYVSRPAAKEWMDPVPLQVTIGLSEVFLRIPETDESPRLEVSVRPTATELVPEEESVQPVDGTVLGRDVKHANITFGANWSLSHPNQNACTDLVSLSLCKLQPIGDGPHGLNLLLRCRDRDLNIKFENKPPKISPKKLAAIRRVLQRLNCSDLDADYILLSRGGVRREARNESDSRRN